MWYMAPPADEARAAARDLLEHYPARPPGESTAAADAPPAADELEGLVGLLASVAESAVVAWRGPSWEASAGERAAVRRAGGRVAVKYLPGSAAIGPELELVGALAIYAVPRAIAELSDAAPDAAPDAASDSPPLYRTADQVAHAG
jgi:hypothetical protein